MALVDAAKRGAIVPIMNDEPRLLPKQVDVMRELHRLYDGDEEKVCIAYAEAERAGRVGRASNERDLSSEDYAKRLYRNGHYVRPGKTKGWLA